MNRAQIETQAPWALQYYDAGVKAGKHGPQQVMLPFDNWLDVIDHIPDIDQLVLCFCNTNGHSVCTYIGFNDDDNCHVWAGNCGAEWDITHWLPLPEQPNTTNRIDRKYE